MGDKLSAKELAISCGVPTIPGSTEPLKNGDEALEKAISYGFPIILKAASGGGGRGMRACYTADEVKPAFDLVRAEAKKLSVMKIFSLKNSSLNPSISKFRFLPMSTETSFIFTSVTARFREDIRKSLSLLRLSQ